MGVDLGDVAVVLLDRLLELCFFARLVLAGFGGLSVQLLCGELWSRLVLSMRRSEVCRVAGDEVGPVWIMWRMISWMYLEVEKSLLEAGHGEG